MIEYDSHFMSTYFLLILLNCRIDLNDIRLELDDKSSIITYFHSTFCPTLGHHQGKMGYKIDVTFVCTLLLCKKNSICTVVLCSICFSNLFYK